MNTSLNYPNFKKCLFFLLILSYQGKAQIAYYQHQISAQYGLASTAYIQWSSSESTSNSTSSFFGPVGLSYHYSLSPRVRLGTSILYGRQNYTSTYYDASGSRATLSATDYQNRYVFFTGDFLYMYGVRNIVRPYFKVSIGGNFKKETIQDVLKNNESITNQYTMLTMQLTPIGLEFGESICGFIELGIGGHGLLTGGIRGRF